MLKEITIPDGYTGTISEENGIILDINNNFAEIESMIMSLPDNQISFEKHIADSENYTIELFFSDNKSHVKLEIDNDNITLVFGDKIVKLDQHGNII